MPIEDLISFGHDGNQELELEAEHMLTIPRHNDKMDELSFPSGTSLKGPRDAVIINGRDLPSIWRVKETIKVDRYEDVHLVARKLLPPLHPDRRKSLKNSDGDDVDSPTSIAMNSVRTVDRSGDFSNVSPSMYPTLDGLAAAYDSSTLHRKSFVNVRRGPAQLKSDDQLLMEAKSGQRRNKEAVLSAIRYEREKPPLENQGGIFTALPRENAFPTIDCGTSILIKQSFSGGSDLSPIRGASDSLSEIIIKKCHPESAGMRSYIMVSSNQPTRRLSRAQVTGRGLNTHTNTHAYN